jgi:hypothetical protein
VRFLVPQRDSQRAHHCIASSCSFIRSLTTHSFHAFPIGAFVSVPHFPLGKDDHPCLVTLLLVTDLRQTVQQANGGKTNSYPSSETSTSRKITELRAAIRFVNKPVEPPEPLKHPGMLPHCHPKPRAPLARNEQQRDRNSSPLFPDLVILEQQYLRALLGLRATDITITITASPSLGLHATNITITITASPSLGLCAIKFYNYNYSESFARPMCHKNYNYSLQDLSLVILNIRSPN